MEFHKSDVMYYIPSNKDSHLDIGANEGALLDHSSVACSTKNLFGIEINKDAVAFAQNKFKEMNNFHFAHGSIDELPFEDSKFDIVTSTEVLEHVPTHLRKKVIIEVRRTIKADGTFIVTVPHRGFFSFLDPSNFRFLAPKLFSMLSRLIGGRDRDKGFEGEKHGVVWHHHFTMKELEEIFSPEFEIVQKRWRGVLITPVVEWIAFPFYRLGLTNSSLFRFLKKIQALEYRFLNSHFFGYNVIIVAKVRP